MNFKTASVPLLVVVYSNLILPESTSALNSTPDAPKNALDVVADAFVPSEVTYIWPVSLTPASLVRE